MHITLLLFSIISAVSPKVFSGGGLSAFRPRTTGKSTQLADSKREKGDSYEMSSIGRFRMNLSIHPSTSSPRYSEVPSSACLEIGFS